MTRQLPVAVWLMVTSLLVMTLSDQDKTRAASQERGSSPYFGQPLPKLGPERFAVGAVSTDAVELNGVFAPNLKEFFFSRRVNGVQTMYHSELVDGTWSEPRELLLFPGRTRAVADDMALSPDARELYFLGNHPHAGDAGVRSADIWRSRRINGTWSTAEIVPAPISTAASEVYPVIVGDGSLYFSSNRPGGRGPISLYRAQRLATGAFAEPLLVPAPINSDFGVGDAFVSPDETYMVLSSGRPPSVGGSDLFVSFRSVTGAWGEPIHLGSTINTKDTEYCPMVTPDGKYLFFSRRDGTSSSSASAGDVYWVDARNLDQFRR